MPGNYSHTNRATGTVLTANIYNTDHQNHIDNLIPSMVDDYSANVAQMQYATDPGEPGTESLAPSLAGEIERLRFMIKEISGKLQWYQSPSASLETLKTNVDTLNSAKFTTGDVKLTLKTVADPGWVLMNDGTLGNAASGATTRAAADTEALFTLLWNNTTNVDCPVSGGRGASAAADFAANKTIALPRALGRALAVYGSGAGLTSRSLAQALGSENASVVSHTHTATVIDPGHSHNIDVYGNAGPFLQIDTQGVSGDPVAISPTRSATTGISVNISTAGVSGSQANMQPTVFLNVMIKL
jgi:microcystin-dependent protein